MKYPDDFDTPAFPAGRPVALSRVMGIALMVVFFLILVLAGAVVWLSRSQNIHPFLVYINRQTGQWMVIGHGHGEKSMTYARTLQESLLNQFTYDWFTISPDDQRNKNIWSKCERASVCAHHPRNDDRCAISCNMEQTGFDNALSNVMEKHNLRFRSGERWNVVSVEMLPSVTMAENGGMWTIYARVNSNISGPFTVIAYADVGYDAVDYPQNMGYYIKTFNAYKISQ